MIGKHIKSARKSAGLTQDELGQLIGISGVAIMRYEKGQREPTKETIEKIAAKLQVSPNELMGWEVAQEKMNPLIYVTISLHFEVSNSEMFGGKGSIGYTATNFGGVKNLEAVDETFIDEHIGSVAGMLNVTKEEIKLISKEEYDLATEEDSERTEIDFDEDGDW